MKRRAYRDYNYVVFVLIRALWRICSKTYCTHMCITYDTTPVAHPQATEAIAFPTSRSTGRINYVEKK